MCSSDVRGTAAQRGVGEREVGEGVRGTLECRVARGGGKGGPRSLSSRGRGAGVLRAATEQLAAPEVDDKRGQRAGPRPGGPGGD